MEARYINSICNIEILKIMMNNGKL